MSAFMSIKEVVKDILGWAAFISFVVNERFPNLEHVKQAKCPCFIMHGLKDELIPPKHSRELSKACPTYCYLHLVENMDHNEFKLKEDLINPFKKFVAQVD